MGLFVFMPSESRQAWLGRRALLAPVVSGVALGLAAEPIGWHPLAVVALVPMAVSLQRCRRAGPLLIGCFIGGAIARLMALDWMRHCYGGSGLSGPYVSVWFFAAALGGLFFVSLALPFRYLTRRGRLPAAVALPAVWIAAEWVWVSAMNHCGLWGAPLMQVGMHLADHPQLIQLADLGGIYGLSGWLAAANGLAADVVLRCASRFAQAGRSDPPSSAPARLVPILAATATVLAAGFWYGQWRLSQTIPRDGAAVTLCGERDLPPLLDRTRLATRPPTSAMQLTPAAIRASAPGGESNAGPAGDLIVWPELAYHHAVEWPRSYGTNDADDSRDEAVAADMSPNATSTVSPDGLSLLRRSAAELNVCLLMGCRRFDRRGEETTLKYNSLVLVGPGQQAIDYYDKRHLLPWTESMPAVVRWLPAPRRDAFAAGARPGLLSVSARGSHRRYQVAAAICSDVVVAAHFRRLMRSDVSPDFFVACGSEGQDSTGALSSLLLRMARLRAIEARRPIVRCVSGGTSGWIDGNGRIVERIAAGGLCRPVALAPLASDRRTSFYVMAGDWLPKTALLFVIGVAVVSSWRTGRTADDERPDRPPANQCPPPLPPPS